MSFKMLSKRFVERILFFFCISEFQNFQEKNGLLTEKTALLHQIEPPLLLSETLDGRTIIYSYSACCSTQILEEKKNGAGRADVCVSRLNCSATSPNEFFGLIFQLPLSRLPSASDLNKSIHRCIEICNKIRCDLVL